MKAARTLNWLRPIGYNLVMAEIRHADFSDPANLGNSGTQWLHALTDVAQDRFKVIFEGFQPNLRLLRGDRSSLNSYAATILSAMVEHGDVDQNDIRDALQVICRYWAWIIQAQYDKGEPA